MISSMISLLTALIQRQTLFFVILLCCLSISPTWATKFGLYSGQIASLKLLNLSTSAIIKGPYAEVQHILIYQNPTDLPLEAMFYFPRTDTSIFHKFEAIFHNKTVVGKILEKTAARAEYTRNVQEGHTVAYSESNSLTPDVMQIKVGNIPVGESVEILFSIIEPLELIINKFWGLKLASVLTKRYTPASVDVRQTPQIVNVPKEDISYPTWKVRVEIDSDSPFSFLHNPSHKLTPHLFEPSVRNSTGVFKAIWEASLVPEKDFTINFMIENPNTINTLVATLPTEDDNHVILINSIPELNTLDVKNAEESLIRDADAVERLQTLLQKEDVANAWGEFIFVIDRSGSMQGERINNLKKALMQFLQLLPTDSFFNIVSFGSTYDLYLEKSQRTSATSLSQVSRWLGTIDADMGGTEILPALQAASALEPRLGYPKIVIALTDGDVSNPDQVIQHALQHSNKMRFCSIGIGYGVSEYLVKNLAKAGKCMSEFVTENEDIAQKAAYIIKAAVSRYLSDVSLNMKCMNSSENVVFQEERKIGILLKDQPLQEWIYLNGIPAVSSCTFDIQYYNSLTNKKVTEKLIVDNIQFAERTDVWHKIAYNAKIREKDILLKSYNPSYNSSIITNEIIDLSTKYQVLSSHTAFLAVIQKDTVNSKTEKITILIPNVDSVDYGTETRYLYWNSSYVTSGSVNGSQGLSTAVSLHLGSRGNAMTEALTCSASDEKLMKRLALYWGRDPKVSYPTSRPNHHENLRTYIRLAVMLLVGLLFFVVLIRAFIDRINDLASYFCRENRSSLTSNKI